jgi:predicted RNase H-like nuclease (RuvC/YqgF family)
MFDMLKNPDEEQATTEPIENIEENCNEENQTEETTPQTENSKEDVLSTLETLGEEERSLLAEKSQLLNMEETLKQRIKDEIEIKRHRIENLKYEIPELKQRCEALAKVLDIPVKK